MATPSVCGSGELSHLDLLGIVSPNRVVALLHAEDSDIQDISDFEASFGQDAGVSAVALALPVDLVVVRVGDEHRLHTEEVKASIS